jgi:hypothetical protein
MGSNLGSGIFQCFHDITSFPLKLSACAEFASRPRRYTAFTAAGHLLVYREYFSYQLRSGKLPPGSFILGSWAIQATTSLPMQYCLPSELMMVVFNWVPLAKQAPAILAVKGCLQCVVSNPRTLSELLTR